MCARAVLSWKVDGGSINQSIIQRNLSPRLARAVGEEQVALRGMKGEAWLSLRRVVRGAPLVRDIC